MSAARNRDALLLAARELVRMMMRALAEADGFQRSHRARVALGRLHRLVRVEQRQLDVVERGRARQKIESLKDKPDLVIANFGELVAAQLGDILPVQEILPARRVIEAPENVHQRRFSRPRGTRRRDELAGLDVERDPAQRVDLHLAHGVGLDRDPGRK